MTLITVPQKSGGPDFQAALQCCRALVNESTNLVLVRELQEVAAEVRGLVGSSSSNQLRRDVQLVQVDEIEELPRDQLVCLKVDDARFGFAHLS